MAGSEQQWTGNITGTQTADITVDATVGGVTLLAANNARRGAMIQNVGTATMRVTIEGTAPTATKGIQLAAGAILKLSQPGCPTGIIKAIREGASSTTASVVEFT